MGEKIREIKKNTNKPPPCLSGAGFWLNSLTASRQNDLLFFSPSILAAIQKRIKPTPNKYFAICAATLKSAGGLII